MNAILDVLRLIAVPLSKAFEWLSGRQKQHTDIISQLQEALAKADMTMANLYNEVMNLRAENSKIYDELLRVKSEANKREVELSAKIDLLQAKIESYEQILTAKNKAGRKPKNAEQ